MRPRAVFIETSGKLHSKIPSSGLIFKCENNASIKTTHATIVLWIVLSPICNMHAITPLWKLFTHSHDQQKVICFIIESHCPYILGIL